MSKNKSTVDPQLHTAAVVVATTVEYPDKDEVHTKAFEAQVRSALERYDIHDDDWRFWIVDSVWLDTQPGAQNLLGITGYIELDMIANSEAKAKNRALTLVGDACKNLVQENNTSIGQSAEISVGSPKPMSRHIVSLSLSMKIVAGEDEDAAGRKAMDYIDFQDHEVAHSVEFHNVMPLRLDSQDDGDVEYSVSLSFSMKAWGTSKADVERRAMDHCAFPDENIMRTVEFHHAEAVAVYRDPAKPEPAAESEAGAQAG